MSDSTKVKVRDLEKFVVQCFLKSGMSDEDSLITADVLIEADGAAAMMRPPSQMPPLDDMDHPQDGLPFELYVRQLGPGTEATQRLVKLIRDWDREGGFSSFRSSQMGLPAIRVRVYSRSRC